MEIAIKNNQRLIKINCQKIKRILRAVIKYIALKDNKQSFLNNSSVEVSVLLVNDKRMRELNHRYRNINKTTDVLSFPQYSVEAQKRGSAKTKTFKSLSLQTPSLVLGDIVINLHKAKRQAEEHGMTFYEEITRLLVHGLLHLIGYDHELGRYQASKMKKMEKELLSALKLI